MVFINSDDTKGHLIEDKAGNYKYDFDESYSVNMNSWSNFVTNKTSVWKSDFGSQSNADFELVFDGDDLYYSHESLVSVNQYLTINSGLTFSGDINKNVNKASFGYTPPPPWYYNRNDYVLKRSTHKGWLQNWHTNSYRINIDIKYNLNGKTYNFNKIVKD